MDDRDHPQTSGAEAVSAMMAEIRGEPAVFRVLLALVMAAAAWGLLSGAWMLVHVHHWVAWTVSFAVIEPLGLASVASVIFLVAPGSAAADLFAFLFTRARVALVVVVASIAIGCLTLLVLVAVERL